MNHTATTLALLSTLYIGGFFGWRFVWALMSGEVAGTTLSYAGGLLAVVLLVQSLREIGG